MNNIYWAGIGYDPPADSFWSRWWTRAEQDIERVVAERCHKQGKFGYVVNEALPLCRFQCYFIPGFYPRIAEFHRFVGEKLFRIGFGLIAHTESEARGLLETAEKFLSDMEIRQCVVVRHPP